MAKTIEERVAELEAKVQRLESRNKPIIRKTGPREITLEIEFPKADVGGLHFNRKFCEATFIEKSEQWISKDILFHSAHNLEDDNNSSALLDYLSDSRIVEQIVDALHEQCDLDVMVDDVRVILPESSDGAKTFNGSREWYWLAAPIASIATLFCRVDNYGSAYNNSASNVYGVAPALCIS